MAWTGFHDGSRLRLLEHRDDLFLGVRLPVLALGPPQPEGYRRMLTPAALASGKRVSRPL